MFQFFILLGWEFHLVRSVGRRTLCGWENTVSRPSKLDGFINMTSQVWWFIIHCTFWLTLWWRNNLQTWLLHHTKLISLCSFCFGAINLFSNGCVGLAALGRPRYIRIALTSFQGLTRVSPSTMTWLCLWSWSLGPDPIRCMTSPREDERSFDNLLSGAHSSKHREFDTGKVIERTQCWTL